ncbi:MAG TPA: hypothetical protein VHE12_03215, partial [bacterium]|nr:hypothetical protein [bacterium]
MIRRTFTQAALCLLLGLPALLLAQSSAHPPNGLVETGGGPWVLSPTPMPVLPMDDITVYAFSQTGTHDIDPQVLDLAPDISIRTWAKWDRYGVQPSDYNF